MKKSTENVPKENKHPHAELVAKLPLELLNELEATTNNAIADIRRAIKGQKTQTYQIQADRRTLEQLSKTISIFRQYLQEGIPKIPDPEAPNLNGKSLSDEYDRAVEKHKFIKERLEFATMNAGYNQYTLEALMKLKNAISEAKDHAKASITDIPGGIPQDSYLMFVDLATSSVTETILRFQSDVATKRFSNNAKIQNQLLFDEKFHDYLYDCKNSLIDPISRAQILFSRNLYTKSLEPLDEAISTLEKEARWMEGYVVNSRARMSDELYTIAYAYQVELQVKIDILQNTKDFLISKTPAAMQEEKVQRRDSLRTQVIEDKKSTSPSPMNSPAVQRVRNVARKLSGTLSRKKTSGSSESPSPSGTPKGSPAPDHRDTPVVETLKGEHEKMKSKEASKPTSSQSESGPESVDTSKTPPDSPKGNQG